MPQLLSIQRIVLLVALVVFASPVLGQAPVIDYLGYGWEADGLPPSNPGDELIFVGVADFADPIFDLDLGTAEVTFHLYDLISTGEVSFGAGASMIAYTGGYLDIYVDAGQNAEWGINPPNATAPSTFTEGLLFFHGSFNDDFTVFLTTAGSGSYEGTLDGLSGELLGGLCEDCVYTWGGAFTPATGAQIPEGYHLQMDGEFEVDPTVDNDNASWSQVKTLFR